MNFCLKSGDLVGIAAPASPLEHNKDYLVNDAVRLLESWGLRVQVQEGIDAKDEYLAGHDDHRAKRLEGLLALPELKGLLFTRGGYGCARLLNRINWDQYPGERIAVGCSDLTTLLFAFDRWGIARAVHGPNIASEKLLANTEEAALNRESLYEQLFNPDYSPNFELECIQPRVKKGRLYGGCLSVLVTLLGTPYEPELEGKILFIEDTGEKLYQIDRMLTHLDNCGKLDGLEAIVLGDFIHTDNDAGVKDFFRKRLGGYDMGVCMGLPVGHGPVNICLPFGAMAQVSNGHFKLER